MSVSDRYLPVRTRLRFGNFGELWREVKGLTMKHFFSIVVLAILFCLLPNLGQAGQEKLALGGMFGKKEEIDTIQDIEGTDYKLAHRYTLYFVFAGVYLSDDGYVLQSKNASGTYYPQSEETIRELQRAGKLQSPLPNYSIPLLQYLFGYSLWIVIAFAVGGPFLLHLLRILMGKRFCPSCKLELTPHEAETKICGVCHTHL